MNYKFLFVAVVLLSVTKIGHGQASAGNRTNELFDFGWKFHYGEMENGAQPGLDDADWRPLDIPHDFQINQPWDSTAGGARGFKNMGVGWYRKTFKADPSWKGKEVLLDFEGIMLTGKAWLNGQKIGETDYGYLGFEADITKLINYDGPNVVAVRASTGKKGGSRWYTGGGLFRDVHLIVKNGVSVARHGVYITTPKVGKSSASVNVQVGIDGIRNKSYNLKVQTDIYGPQGEKVATAVVDAPKRNKLSTVEVKLPLITVNQPKLWSCETPALYTAKVSLLLDGKQIDQVVQPFGIRTIEFSKEFGFKLNGKKVFLKGIANHDDLGAVGVAAYETAIAREMDTLKAYGFNTIRTSHNPYSAAFLRLADEKGFLVVDELYDKWSNKSYWAGSQPWTSIWYQNEIEWLKRDRNHPSVILWSFGNELQMREDLAGFPTGDWGVTTYRIMNVLAKRYDSTRKTTVAMFPARAGAIGKSDPDFDIKIYPPELATVTEVSSFNYRWKNYPDYLKHAPDMNIFQSEASTNELTAPYFGMDREKMIGLAYWGAISYWGESNGWPKKGWDYSFFDHALNPYPQAYLIKSIFKDEPIVRIAVQGTAADSITWNDIVVGRNHVQSQWNWTPGRKYNIYTYTNAEEVELFVNGKSVGVQKNSGTGDKQHVILWKQIPYHAGKILAIARSGGKEVARHELHTTGKAVALKMVAENKDWKANGMALNYIKVYAVDKRGEQVYTVNPEEVTFQVSGAAKLIAVDNGDQYSDELFNTKSRRLHNGFVMGILRAGRTAGAVSISVSAPGLKGGSLQLSMH